MVGFWAESVHTAIELTSTATRSLETISGVDTRRGLN